MVELHAQFDTDVRLDKLYQLVSEAFQLNLHTFCFGFVGEDTGVKLGLLWVASLSMTARMTDH